jgi:hypothetical protein
MHMHMHMHMHTLVVIAAGRQQGRLAGLLQPPVHTHRHAKAGGRTLHKGTPLRYVKGGTASKKGLNSGLPAGNTSW